MSLDIVLDWFEDAEPIPAYTELLKLASLTAQYLTTPWAIKIKVGLVVDQETGEPINPQPTGAEMQLRTNEQVTYTITALDSKGYVVDTVDFSGEIDNGDVAAITDNGNTFLVVAGAPGSAVITFTDGTLTATEALDVVPGDVATISVVAGAAEEQPSDDTTPTDPNAPVDPNNPNPTDPNVGPTNPAVDPNNPDNPVVNPLS
jgi:hypothetical protein